MTILKSTMSWRRRRLARFSRAWIQTDAPHPRRTLVIAQIEGLPLGTLDFRAHGQVPAQDYANIIVPEVEAAFALNRTMRLLYVTDDVFTGLDPRSAESTGGEKGDSRCRSR